MNISIELRHLRYFIAVAEELNLTHAAKRLNTVAPSLGNQIRQLEEFVGEALLHREGHKLALTEAGRTLLNESRKLFLDLEVMLEKVHCAGQAEGTRITIAVFHGAEWRLYPKLLPFMRAHCSKLDLRFRTMNPPEMLEAIRNRTIDVALMRGPILEDEIATKLILTDKFMAVIPAQHALAKLKRIALKDLADLPFVAISRDVAPQLHQLVDKLASEAGVQFRRSVETEDLLSTVITVGTANGFALLPHYVEDILPKTVVVRPLDITPTPTGELVAAYRKGNSHASLHLFLDKLRECFNTAEGKASQ